MTEGFHLLMVYFIYNTILDGIQYLSRDRQNYDRTRHVSLNQIQ